MLSQIANDEESHADLAWSVAEWVDARLSKADLAHARARLRRAQVSLGAKAGLTPAEAQV